MRPGALPRRAFVALAVLSGVLSSAGVFPHGLSYFNEFAGGPLNGPAHLLDANIDWGQDLLELKRWAASNAEHQNIEALCFSRVAPASAGIAIGGSAGDRTRFEALPGGTTRRWLAVSVNPLYGYKHEGHEDDRFRETRASPPAARAGYSIRIFPGAAFPRHLRPHGPPVGP